MDKLLRFLLLVVLLTALLALGTTGDAAVDSALDAENATPAASEKVLTAARDDGEQPLVQRSGRPERRCPQDEVYCRETGNREEMRCPLSPESTAKAATVEEGGGLPEIRFRACVPVEKENPTRSVVFFELAMAVALAGAYVLLRREQQKHMSSFDLRKDPRQRGSLLGSVSASGPKGAD
ncbi:hypothetical protein PybrP1_000973 [[Pythium] brassicae (nom. inval.)]|nr:hypothetical protein PybrP1_000973 [[Pythium] brassicae (nom. inval.)]